MKIENMKTEELLTKIFTTDELKEADKIIKVCRKDNVQPNATLKREFVTPEMMKKVEKKAGQKMDASYVGYLVEYYFTLREA